MRSPLFHDMSLDSLVEEAVEFIIGNPTPIGYYVGFSGGKDSITLAKLFELAGVKHTLFYNCTTIDPPEVVKFIKEHYPQCLFYYPKRPFWRSILTKGVPTVKTRWCCDALKKRVNKKSHVYLGVRKEESLSRKKYPRINVVSIRRERPTTSLYPILEWTEADIWEFIEFHNLPYPSLYDEGFDRLGCIICPFRNYYDHMRFKARYPGIYKVFEKVVTKWWLEKKASGRAMKHNTPTEFIESWYRNRRVKGVECSQLPFVNERLKGAFEL